MKRLVASRKLKRTCIYCNNGFKKGQVYYIRRIVIADKRIYSNEYLVCPKCKYKAEQKTIRYKKFKEKCVHPKEFIITNYTYIQGEAVQEPSYDYCQLCGEVL